MFFWVGRNLVLALATVMGLGSAFSEWARIIFKYVFWAGLGLMDWARVCRLC